MALTRTAWEMIHLATHSSTPQPNGNYLSRRTSESISREIIRGPRSADYPLHDHCGTRAHTGKPSPTERASPLRMSAPAKGVAALRASHAGSKI